MFKPLDSVEVQERCQARINSLKLEIERLQRIHDEGICDHSVTEWSGYHDAPYCVICNINVATLELEEMEEQEND